MAAPSYTLPSPQLYCTFVITVLITDADNTGNSHHLSSMVQRTLPGLLHASPWVLKTSPRGQHPGICSGAGEMKALSRAIAPVSDPYASQVCLSRVPHLPPPRILPGLWGAITCSGPDYATHSPRTERVLSLLIYEMVVITPGSPGGWEE